MSQTTLFYATNRKHIGNRWEPTGYGSEFSTNGAQNLRFGKLELDVNQAKITQYLNKKIKDIERIGDGEGLSGYITKQVKHAKIHAYEDLSGEAKKPISDDKNASSKMFRDLRKIMNDAVDVVIYIHGFNVSWSEAVGGALALQYMLNRKNEDSQKQVRVVLFSWPSDGSMMPFIAYRSDRADAEASGYAVGRGLLKLRDFLRMLWSKDQLCHREIHLLCHSMGNYVLQNALNKMILFSEGSSLPRLFQHIFLCAPDVADTVLEEGQPLERLNELCRNVTLYFNRGDFPMYISDYTKGNTDRLGHSGSARPRLLHNKINQVDCSSIVEGIVEHSYYLWATVNDDIRLSVDGKNFEDGERKRQEIATGWMMI